MKTIAFFFGGRTVEHDISIVTGHQAMENINQDNYNIVPVYISRDGKWYTGDPLRDMSFYNNFDPSAKGVSEVYMMPIPGRSELYTLEPAKLFGKKNTTIAFDVALLSMHGVNGEDGTLQGLLELADVPYTSAGTLGSAVGMDKILMKHAFIGAGLPVAEAEWFVRDQWEMNPDGVVETLEAKLQYPMFVKPANLGSSIGISCAEERDSLYAAIEVACRYDTRIIVENALLDAVEINCSAMGYGADVRASACEQPVSWEEFLSFDDKYLRNAKTPQASGGMKGMSRILPAPIPDDLRDYIQDMTLRIFKLFDCKGVVRVDYMVDMDGGVVYVNEINTIPGSLAFYLWEEVGVPFAQLLDQMIRDAIDAHREKQRNTYAYDSDVLKKVNFGGIKMAKTGQVKNKVQR